MGTGAAMTTILRLSPARRRYGYIPNPPDHRDFGLLHHALPFTPTLSLDRKTPNAKYLGPQRDQGEQGSCTGHAEAGDRDYLYNMLKQYEPTQLAGAPNFSPEFAYWGGRRMDGSLGEGDTGSTGRSVAKAARKFGICQEADLPYNDKVVTDAPPQAALSNALLFRSGAYHKLSTVGDIKACLGSKPFGYAVSLGFNVYDSFENDVKADGLMPTPDFALEQLQGGHQVLIYDFDDDAAMGDGTVGGFAIKNSWGPSWGDNGSFHMSYRQAADPRIVLDLTMQHLGRPWERA